MQPPPPSEHWPAIASNSETEGDRTGVTADVQTTRQRKRKRPAIELIPSFWKCMIMLVCVAQSTSHRCESCMAFLFWVCMELYVPKTTKMTPFLMHNLITERTSAAPWRRRNAGLVRASRSSLGGVPGARAVQLAKPNSGQKWRFLWLRPRANPKRRQNAKEACGRGQERRWQSANASRTWVPIPPHSDRL